MEKYLNKEKLSMVIAIIFIIGICVFLWKASAVIIGTMITASAGITVALLTQQKIKLREIEESHRPKKVEIYQNFLNTVTAIIGGQNENISIQAPSEQELADYMFKFKMDILLWASPNVIKAQLEFENVSESGGDVLIAVNNVYKAMREDIGLSNSGLDNLELIKIFLNEQGRIDIEQSKILSR
ncbi:MAG: hypothetical protein WBI40_05085 [Methylococcaceae bacterium]